MVLVPHSTLQELRDRLHQISPGHAATRFPPLIQSIRRAQNKTVVILNVVKRVADGTPCRETNQVRLGENAYI